MHIQITVYVYIACTLCNEQHTCISPRTASRSKFRHGSTDRNGSRSRDDCATVRYDVA